MKRISLVKLSEQKMKVIKGGSENAIVSTANCDCGNACGDCATINVRGTMSGVLGTLMGFQKPQVML
jgi:natural product precursor